MSDALQDLLVGRGHEMPVRPENGHVHGLNLVDRLEQDNSGRENRGVREYAPLLANHHRDAGFHQVTGDEKARIQIAMLDLDRQVGNRFHWISRGFLGYRHVASRGLSDLS